MKSQYESQISSLFRKYLPVVIDVETGGFDYQKSALLEVAVVFLNYKEGVLSPSDNSHYYIEPFKNSLICKDSADYIGYDACSQQVRNDESEVLQVIQKLISKRLKNEKCSRAILVGHNASFDLNFLQVAFERNEIKSPFHPFSTLDTVTSSALVYGHTVLSKSCELAGLKWDNAQAHNALYDCRQTANLFCLAFNQIKMEQFNFE